MTRYALSLPLFREVVATQSYRTATLPASAHVRPLKWTNTNQLLRTRIRGATCIGVKTVRSTEDRGFALCLWWWDGLLKGLVCNSCSTLLHMCWECCCRLSTSHLLPFSFGV